MSEAKGIQETKDVLNLMVGIAKAVKAAEADGKIGPEDLAQLIAIFPLIGPAMDHIGDVPAEFKDLSVAEAEELAAVVVAQLPGLDNAKVASIVDAALKAAVANYGLLKAIKG